ALILFFLALTSLRPLRCAGVHVPECCACGPPRSTPLAIWSALLVPQFHVSSARVWVNPDNRLKVLKCNRQRRLVCFCFTVGSVCLRLSGGCRLWLIARLLCE